MGQAERSLVARRILTHINNIDPAAFCASSWVVGLYKMRIFERRADCQTFSVDLPNVPGRFGKPRLSQASVL